MLTSRGTALITSQWPVLTCAASRCARRGIAMFTSYDKAMKHFLLAAAAMLVSITVSAAGLGDIKTVYLLPMSNGLDQYLAQQLTSEAVLQVVTDPEKADAVFTDHLGETFEQTLADLYAPKPKSDDKADENAEDKGAPRARSGMQGKRGRGTIFLVNRRTHDVLWSVYELPKANQPAGLRHSAGRISSQLAKSIKGK